MFSSEQWLANSGGDFYNGVATQSLRFNSASSTILTKSFSAGDRKTCTFSFWLKRTIINTSQMIISGGAGNGNNDYWFHFEAGNVLTFRNITGGSYTLVAKTTRVFRDTSAWYHFCLVIDTTEATAGNRIRLWVNGVLETLTISTNTTSQNDNTSVNYGGTHKIGVLSYSAQQYLNGYLADVNVLDGVAIKDSDSDGYLDQFGEQKGGIWIAKEYTGSYGTNGYRLEFKQTGDGSSTASSTTIGADTANSNHFKDANLDAYDSNMPDSPENNFCTLNPNARGTTNIASSEGNLKFVKSGANYGNIFSTFALFGGKWYFEGRCHSSALAQIGVQEITNNIYQSSGDYGASTDLGMWDSRGYYLDEGTAGGSPPTYTTGDIIGVAFDVDAGKIWFSKNGTYNHSGDPANGTNQTTGSTNDLSSIGVTPAGNGENGGGHVLNFGADASFAGAITAGTETDGNGYGLFKYAPPNLFLSLCTKNLPEPTIGANSDTQSTDHFTPYIWTGNDSNPRAFTDVGFQADWIWIKKRSGAGTSHHLVADSSRGDGKTMLANEPNVEATNDANGTVSDTTTVGGFTVNAGSSSDEMVNDGSDTYVAWLWKCNAGVTTTNDASATSIGTIDSVYQANTDVGFSIVTYTGTGSSGSIAHGLKIGTTATAPDFVIIKKRNASNRWFVWTHADDTKYLYLNDTFARQDGLASRFGNDSAITQPTTTLLTLGTHTDVNASNTYVAYCFAEIEGYSKFSSYIGNGSADGTFVYTGFRPAFVMIKQSNASGNSWHIIDNKRIGYNERNDLLLADLSATEQTNYTVQERDLLSNGFKMRDSNAGTNGNGSTFIYMAFAESPFKYANAR